MQISTVRAGRYASLTLAVVLFACGGGDDAATIDRETFVSAYVDLRTEALFNDSSRITDEERTQVLQQYGVTEDDLLAFADVHGRDVEYMRNVWDEIEERLDAMRPEIDESGRVVRPIRRSN